MSKIFVIGTGPLIEPGVKFFSGQCLRTNHFVEPLLEAGHKVMLFTHPISDRPYLTELETENDFFETRSFHDFEYQFLKSNEDKFILPILQRSLDEYKPDAILGINPFPSYLACKLDSKLPAWVDLNGYAMVEGQTRAYVYNDDSCLYHFLKHEKTFIRRADYFSTVSNPQKYAVLGELSMVGRLNKFTFDEDLVTTIPNAVNPHYAKITERKQIEDDLFRVLWSGGFNTWTDVDLLFNGLVKAMEAHSNLRFISTGGMIDGHDEKTYSRFQELIKDSPLADRFDLRGWVASEEADDLLLKCQLGINIDAKNYETMFGARNRITTMMACGLPVLTTLGTEISHQLNEQGLGLFFEPGDVNGFAEGMDYAIRNRDELKVIADHAREFALSEFEPQRTIAKFLEWAEDPKHSKDNQERFEKNLPFLNAIEEEFSILDENPVHELMIARRDLKLLRNKPLFKLMKKIKSLLGKSE